jgi:AcrR family transcriptional regulator
MTNTREQILAATERIIQEKGLARVTTREIARKAGCSEGALYKHFVGKESLFLEVIQTCLPELIEVMQIDMAGKRSVRENLEAIIHMAISYYEKVLPLSLALFADQDLLAQHRQWMEEQQVGPLNIYQHVATYIQAEQRARRLKKELDPFSIACVLLGPCHQYVFVRCMSGTTCFPQTEQQFVEGIVETLLAGIVADE